MYLKSLNIVGFKTFAEETEILFDPGFTAVVGPNGSGKSNIVDAIKWVFGEKSAKGLRGDKMDDVIFHGTDSRKPAGFAEVTIEFDNSDRNIHLDYPSVKITRRLYPDGTNEYYVNDSKMIRKEVEKILLDTGIGKVNYSIMEQGKVDRILYAKPEERRSLFEEAAGISKFKLERQEALKKLNDTKQNLLRISDILNSMSKELEVKKNQAEKAEVYFKLKNGLSEADKKLRFLKIGTISAKLAQTVTELEELKKKNQDILHLIEEETGKINVLEKEKITLESKVTDIDKKLMEYLSLNKMQKEKFEHTKTIISEYIERIDGLGDEAREEAGRIADLENEIVQQKETISQCILEIESRNERQVELSVIITEKDEAVEKETTRIRENQNAIEENDKTHVALREKLKGVILDIISELEEKKKEAFKDHAEREILKTSLLGRVDEYIAVRNAVLNSTADLHESMAKLDFEELKKNYEAFIAKEDSFRNLFFHQNSSLREKEILDARIEDLLLENDNHSRNTKESYARIESIREDIENLKNERVELEKKTLELNGKKESAEYSIQKLAQRLDEVNARIISISKASEEIQFKKMEYEEEVVRIESEIEESYNQFLGMSRLLESEKENLRNLTGQLQEIKNNINQNQENFKNLLPLLTELERNSTGQKVQLDSLNEELYNDYTLTFEEMKGDYAEMEIVKSREEQQLRTIKADIQNIGSVNPMAVEEYNNIREIYDHNKAQKDDIEKSKKDVEDVLLKLNEKSETIFKEVFDQIAINFQETFATLFSGGRAALEMVNTDDALNTGIEILAEPPGKHVQNLRLLSGGEKSLTAVALLFAIYMVKPSPFCFLDEIDAALDEINKNRFCNILDKFKKNTQFIVISHAQSTISRANTIFGITNESPGISKIVSLRLEEAAEMSETLTKAV